MTSTYNQYWKPIVDRTLAENARHKADIVASESKAAICIDQFMQGKLSILDNPKIYHPTNPHELWRCLYLLDKHPDYRERLNELAVLSSAWRLLIQYWIPLEKMIRGEWPNYDAPHTAEKMKRMLASVK